MRGSPNPAWFLTEGLLFVLVSRFISAGSFRAVQVWRKRKSEEEKTFGRSLMRGRETCAQRDPRTTGVPLFKFNFDRKPDLELVFILVFLSIRYDSVGPAKCFAWESGLRFVSFRVQTS